MPQESNGVGSIRSFLRTLTEKTKNLPLKVKKPKAVSWIVGKLVYEALIHGLKNKDLGDAVYLPSIMLKLNTDLFLDDKNIKEVENQLNTKIHVLDDSNDIINTLIG